MSPDTLGLRCWLCKRFILAISFDSLLKKNRSILESIMDAIAKSFRIVAFIGTIIGLFAFMDQCLNILTSIFVSQYQTLIKPDDLASTHGIIMAFVFILTYGGHQKIIPNMPNIVCPGNPYFDKSGKPKLRPTK